MIEIIRNAGKECDAEILADENYLHMADVKLDKELKKCHKEQNLEEFADLREALYTAAVAKGCFAVE